MTDAEALAPKLAGVLEPALGAGTAVENLHTLTGGASRTTWAFDAVTGAQRRSLILRTGPPDEVHAGMELEARAQRAAAAAGAPVPHIIVADDSVAALGNPFLICDAIGGETIVRRIQRTLDRARAGARLLGQCAEALAAIHRADTDLPGVSHEDQLAEWREQLDIMGDTTATFEWAFRWLADNRPTPSPPRLVHGDFRMGNLIVDGSDLAAVLDWELVHVGEVYEDLAWFCIRAWRFGAPVGSRGRRIGQHRGFSSRLRKCRRCAGRSGRVSLVVGAGDAALGCHLPLPGRTPPERTEPLGGARDDRSPGLRDGMGLAELAR